MSIGTGKVKKVFGYVEEFIVIFALGYLTIASMFGMLYERISIFLLAGMAAGFFAALVISFLIDRMFRSRPITGDMPVIKIDREKDGD